MGKSLQLRQYITLILAVIVSGVSQGLLMSLLSIILEKEGISSSLNSINALALYIGMLVITPLLEAPVRRFGYKPVILTGIVMVTIGTILFPFWQSFIFWMFLRFIVGVGDSFLHFATQTWIVSTAAEHERGRKITFYGFSYGIGFGIGPLGINLLEIHPWAPFLALFIFYIMVLLFAIRLTNDFPVKEESAAEKGSFSRYKQVIRLAWFTLLPSFLFSYLEASLNNNFPVYALKEGMSQQWISFLLPSFVIGGLLMQIPLGILSDRIGRKRILIAVLTMGGLLLAFIPAFIHAEPVLLILFILSGGLVGSLFSLGLAYMADLLPPALVATGNVLASTVFSIGSLVGVYLNGLLIQLIGGNFIFYILSGCYIFAAVSGFLFKGYQKEESVHLLSEQSG